MKSKIDEVILLLSDLSNCITIIAEEQANYLGISQVIVDKLEQLRPYVELGEYYYKKIGINTLQSMWSTEREYVKKLIKQIKEQKQ